MVQLAFIKLLRLFNDFGRHRKVKTRFFEDSWPLLDTITFAGLSFLRAELT